MSCRLWPKGMLVCRPGGISFGSIFWAAGVSFFPYVLFAILFYSLGAIWSAGFFFFFFFLLSVFGGFHSVDLHLPYYLTIFSSLRALIRPTWLWHVALLLSFLLLFSGLLFRWGKKSRGSLDTGWREYFYSFFLSYLRFLVRFGAHVGKRWKAG